MREDNQKMQPGMMRRRASDQAENIPAGPGTGPIDLAHLERATFGDQALRREVLTLFERQTAQLAAEIADASTEAARSETAHKLRGAALGIGANTLAEAAAVIELSRGDAIELAHAIARMAAHMAEVRKEITRLLAAN